MKNQYVGDIGDYGKYALLKAFSDEGILLGINWYLTKNDGSNDGKFITYLNDGGYHDLSPGIFEALKRIAGKKNKSVRDIEKASLIRNAVYYSEILDTNSLAWKERAAKRYYWHLEAIKKLDKAALIFVDPDNGVLGQKTIQSKDAEKFVSQEELRDYYTAGKNVVYYCHKGRRKEEAWKIKKEEMKRYLPDVSIRTLTFHRGTQRSYVFLIHKKDVRKYNRIIQSFLMSRWGEGPKPIFTLE